jgi:hypothetical protein
VTNPFRTLRALYRLARCTTLAEIGAENARWVERDAAYPNNDVIADLNRLGFVVDFVCDGVDNEHMDGRAVIVGFASDEIKDWLDEAIYFGYTERYEHDRFGFEVQDLFDPNGDDDRYEGLVTTRDLAGEAIFRTPDQRGAREIRRDYWYCLRGQRALRSAWQVTIYGPFGTNDLWAVLRDACQARRATADTVGGVR